MRTSAIFLLTAALCPSAEVDPAKLSAFRPLPAAVESEANPITEAKVRLGKMLYYETRLSKDGKVSCNTCHPLDKYGAEEERFSSGVGGQKGGRNAPTVYNAAGHLAQFWDGRAADVEEQAKGPVLNPVEMAMPNAEAVVQVLESIPAYTTAFRQAFPGQAKPVTFDNAARAIGAFERRLMTPSRWDRYLKGDKGALAAEEIAGFNRFTSLGCQTCHMGPYVGGAMFQRFGVAKPYPDESDAGRYAITRQNPDRMVFKVPSLRNIAKTGPYFHNGSATTLDEAVRTMAEYQLATRLGPQDVRAITAWLNALTGEIPAEYIKPPRLP